MTAAPAAHDARAGLGILDFRRINPRALLYVTLAVVAAGTICRLAFAATIDLGTDEAYYWTWSKEGVVSFLDHPPMIAWFIRLGTGLFGDTPLGVRFMGIPALLATEWLLSDIVRRTTGDRRAGLFVVLAMEATLAYGVVIMLAKPDVPLLPFAAAMMWALVRLDQTRDPRWWLAAGAFGGLALLSKYTALLLVPAVLVFVVWPKPNRAWLRGPWPWLALAIAVAIFSPVLAWNAAHGWASFLYQGQRAVAASWSPSDFVNFLAVSLAFVGPVMAPVVVTGSIAALVAALRRERAPDILLATACLLPLAYFAYRSLSVEILPTWPYGIWMFGIAAAAINAGRIWASDGRRASAIGSWATIALLSGGIIVAAAFFHALADRSVWFGRLDPLGQEAGFTELARDVARAAEANSATSIATTDYRTYAMLRWHLDGTPVVQVNERSRFLGFGLPAEGALGGPVLLVTNKARPDVDLNLPAEATSRPVGGVDRVWRGVTFGTYDLELITGWTPDLTPSPGTPAYDWPVLAR